MDTRVAEDRLPKMVEYDKGNGQRLLVGYTKDHVCICFVTLKVYKELERLLKLSDINMSADKVLALAQTITIQIKLPLNKQIINRTMLMKRYQCIAPLFADEFWGTR